MQKKIGNQSEKQMKNQMENQMEKQMENQIEIQMEKQNCINEKQLDGQSNPIKGDKLKTILEQMEKCICNIIDSKGGTGTGFFCRIPYPDFFNLESVLITNNHVLEENDILEGKTIHFTLSKEKIKKKIAIVNKRKTYSNKHLDVTIIQLFPSEDSIEQDSFLDIDKKIFIEDPNKEFKNKDIYIIGKIEEFSHGKIKGIDEDGIFIQHLCSTESGMSGSPIINLNNERILGIHKGGHPTKQWNLGIFLREPLKQFYAIKNENLKNQITTEKQEIPNKNKDILNKNEILIEGKNDKILKKDNFIKKKKKLPDTIPRAVSLEEMKKCENMNNKICIIYSRERYKANGFFCNFRYNDNILNVLMTNYHVLTEYDLLIGKEITFIVFYDKYKDYENYKILIDESRKVYTNEEYDITIVEIKKEDKIDNISFFEIDNRIFENPIENFRKEQIFMLQYMEKNKYLNYSSGIIGDIKEDNYTILHYCYSDYIGTGAPLIDSTNFQVIGIHLGGRKSKHSKVFCFVGGLLKEPIEKFFEKFDLENKYIKKKDNLLLNTNKNNKKDINFFENCCCCVSIYDKIPSSISLEDMRHLQYIMERAICKIDCDDGRKGTGFFCTIEFEHKFYLRVLMTTNNVLNKIDLSIGKTINISINNEKKCHKIIIDKLRKIYTNEEYNITIIEIKYQDKLNCVNFLEIIDDKIPTKIWLLHYANEEMKFSNGILKEVDNKDTIEYLCDVNDSSSGGPLINYYYKVVGIHIGSRNYFSYSNYGKLLINPIKYFFEKYN